MEQINKTEEDYVNKPRHYNRGKIEVLTFIEDQKLNFHRGSVLKYICRAGLKDASKEIEDLEKAKYYIEREIQRLKSSEAPIGLAKAYLNPSTQL